MNVSPLSLLPESLQKDLISCQYLPSIPSMALKVIEASKDPDISLSEVASIISSDPAIVVKLLKIANSSAYSQRRSVNNLREALTLLGFNASLTVALSFSLMHSLKNDHPFATKYEEFWQRSIMSASIARLLGSILGITKLEDLFLVGLLQDIGVLVLGCIKNSPYECESSKDFLHHEDRVRLEKDNLGIDHSLVGAWLLKSWKLPDDLVNAVMYSHSFNPEILKENTANNDFNYCLNFSGVIADLWLDENAKNQLETTMDATKMFLGIDSVVFNQLLFDINHILPEISELFEISLISEAERDRILDEARELLLDRSVQFIKQSEEDRREVENISEKVKVVEKINQLDHLTSVFNRRHIEIILEEEYENANVNKWPLSLAFIDIDDFKHINDEYGHLAGDEILKFISSFFSKNIRETDMLARYGGDEFLLMLPGATSDIAKSLLERLLISFKKEATQNINGVDILASVSIGIATHMDKHDFNTLKDFMGAADKALYQAKEKGKNCLAVY